MLSRENSFFILSQRIQRGDDDRGVSRENDSFFLIFATWASPLQGHSINNIFKEGPNSKIAYYYTESASVAQGYMKSESKKRALRSKICH